MTTVIAPAPAAAANPLWSEVELPRNTPNRTAWLVTCVDLTSLLVGFFVLVFSTQTLERDKWETITGSFQQQFAPRAAVVASVPDGGNNAVVRVTGVKSGVAYLDTLLHQRLAGDAVWGDIQAVRGSGVAGQDLRYPLNTTAMQADAAAWARLGGVVRGWKNAVGIRANVVPGAAMKTAPNGYALYEKLRDGGAANAFFEVVVADKMNAAPYELVVRAR